MLALGLFSTALAILAIVTATWGLDQRRAYRIAERRRATAFRLAELAAEGHRHQRAISAEAMRRLRAAYRAEPFTPTCSRDMHDTN